MTISLYRQFRQTLKVTPFHGALAPYNWGQLPKTLDFAWAAYSQMFNEFSSELANITNDLHRYTHQLTAWRDVLADMDLQGQLDASVEFVDPLGTLSLNLPYVIRSRFIFATAHLCHQANRAKQRSEWKDDFPLDTDVWFETTDTCGKPWRRYSALKTRIEKIGGKDFQKATRDFRNSYNHRFSPNIVLGLSNLVTRKVNPKNDTISYGFGETPALGLPLVVTLLEQQCLHIAQAFKAFQNLIREHEAAIEIHNSESLAGVNKNQPSKDI